MKFILLTILVFSASVGSSAITASTTTEDKPNTLSTAMQSVFVGRDIEVSDYNDHLKSVLVDSEDIFFTSHDGRYVFGGVVLDTERRIDIVEEQKSKQRLATLKAQPTSLFVHYPSTGETKHELTVFTDIDCPYCRKLHNSIGDLNDRGVTVNYAMLPRARANSASYAKTLAALCSSNPPETVTRAMRNQNTPSKQCDATRLNQHIKLANTLKINSTPTIVLPNGQLQLGAVSADRLISVLNGER